MRHSRSACASPAGPPRSWIRGESLRFRDWCEANDCFVLSLNGFPHGRFHGAGVKEKVYLPDWRDPARSAYTRRLADLLADWLPAGVVGSISSVPVAFRPGFREEDWPAVRRHLIETLEHLERIRQERGVEILLALEPEPGCVLESTAEQALACFERLQLPPPLAELAGLCFDCCHQAVEFEDPRRLPGRSRRRRHPHRQAPGVVGAARAG